MQLDTQVLQRTAVTPEDVCKAFPARGALHCEVVQKSEPFAPELHRRSVYREMGRSA
jgi:hypothetical protein